MQHAEDEELIEEARRSPDTLVRRELIGKLFLRHQSKVILWCYRFTGNRDRAADLTQEIFYKAYANLESFQGDAKFSTWLYSITVNHCRDDASKRATRQERLSEPLTMDIPHYDSFDVRLEEEQVVQILRDMMCTSLNETEQKVLFLHYGEGMKLDEVTRLLCLENSSGAKAHVVNARRKLAAAVKRWKERSDNRRRNKWTS